MERYSVITTKNPREILLLRGSGCKWRRCAFCDYHLDFSPDDEANFLLNKPIIHKVTGKYKKLEVINSGSFTDLDDKTVEAILNKCTETGINEVHFEGHWMHRNEVKAFKALFAERGINVKIKIGVETFDYDFREKVLRKGIDEIDPKIISQGFDEVCLLFGIKGQTAVSMKNDIETGLKYFQRVCVNIMCENTTSIKPDREVISLFINEILPVYKDNERIDILINNTDFGVGG